LEVVLVFSAFSVFSALSDLSALSELLEWPAVKLGLEELKWKKPLIWRLRDFDRWGESGPSFVTSTSGFSAI
jgi:hypothetical protein